MIRTILGGTFDPIHWGHLRTAHHVSTHLASDCLVLMPSAQPPHRDGPQASATQRFAMAQLAAAELPNCIADDWELQQPRRSYTQLTLAQLHQRWPKDTLIFLLGEDAFAGLSSWYQWQRLVEHAHLVVMRRPNSMRHYPAELTEWLAHVETTSIAALQQQPQGLVYFAESPLISISATAIRTAIQTQQPWRDDVPPAVADYIEQHQLYR